MAVTRAATTTSTQSTSTADIDTLFLERDDRRIRQAEFLRSSLRRSPTRTVGWSLDAKLIHFRFATLVRICRADSFEPKDGLELCDARVLALAAARRTTECTDGHFRLAVLQS